MTKISFDAKIDCANCANQMENAIRKIDGIKSASVNFMTQKIHIETDGEVNEKILIKNIKKTCKRIDPDFKISEK